QIGLIPARYPAPIDKNYADLDDASNLSRRTDWQQISQDIYFGTGQKMWMSDAGEYALLDMRSITFHHGQLN
ncbi:MAG: type VI secretion system accessory protein TagJ, partial [Advenella sp.]